MTPTAIPPDFPRTAPSGAVPGAQPKLLVREDGDRFVAGPSEQDLQARYVMCEDLAHQLVAYSARKRTEEPARPEAPLRNKLTRAVRRKAFGWGLSPAETEWVLRRFEFLTTATAPKDQK